LVHQRGNPARQPVSDFLLGVKTTAANTTGGVQ